VVKPGNGVVKPGNGVVKPGRAMIEQHKHLVSSFIQINLKLSERSLSGAAK
jgi:hypothetical protein